MFFDSAKYKRGFQMQNNEKLSFEIENSLKVCGKVRKKEKNRLNRGKGK